MSAAGWFIVPLALVGANLPFLNQRLFAAVLSKAAKKKRMGPDCRTDRAVLSWSARWGFRCEARARQTASGTVGSSSTRSRSRYCVVFALPRLHLSGSSVKRRRRASRCRAPSCSRGPRHGCNFPITTPVRTETCVDAKTRPPGAVL